MRYFVQGYAYSRNYVYCFCNVFQGVRLFQSLEYKDVQWIFKKMQWICKSNKVQNMKMHKIWHKIHCLSNFMTLVFSLVYPRTYQSEEWCREPSWVQVIYEVRIQLHTITYQFPHCTLLVLIDFCPVQGELLTWSWRTKTFNILSEIIIEYQIQAYLFPILSF